MPLLFPTMIVSLIAADPTIQPPVAKIVPKTMTVLGDTRVDNYFWLRDRKDPDTLKYLEEENRYTEAMMKSTDGLQTKLYSEILGRIKQTDLSVPVNRRATDTPDRHGILDDDVVGIRAYPQGQIPYVLEINPRLVKALHEIAVHDVIVAAGRSAVVDVERVPNARVAGEADRAVDGTEAGRRGTDGD